MRRPARLLLLLLPVAVTAGILLAVVRDGRPLPAPRAPPVPSAPEPAVPPEPGTFRPWQTTATLVEDLRDALGDPRADLEAEWRRVSEALRPHAAWTLENVAPREKSPRVRALVVLAAGVHLPGDPRLGSFARDPEEVVRTAADLARRYREGGAKVDFLGRLSLPVGEVSSPR